MLEGGDIQMSHVSVLCQWCVSGVSVLFQLCVSFVSVLCQFCISHVSVMCRWYVSHVSLVCQWYVSLVSRYLETLRTQLLTKNLSKDTENPAGRSDSRNTVGSPGRI